MVKIFDEELMDELEDTINDFGKTRTIKNISISAYRVGYTAAVLYEE